MTPSERVLEFCPRCGRRNAGIHTCNPQLHVSPALLRVAEACVEGSFALDTESLYAKTKDRKHAGKELADTLRAHARAIREGRFTDTLEQEGTTHG